VTAAGGGLPVQPTATGIRLTIRVTPRAPKDSVSGVRDNRLIVRVTAPPVDQAANNAVVALLSKLLDLRKCAIRIVAGAGSRNKTLEIDGVSVAIARQRLGV
jgi:uncharacterized protein (TIGR00251 family)